MSATLRTPTIPFRYQSAMMIHSRLRSELADNPAALARWKAYEAEYREREAGYNSAHVRGFSKGERSGKITR